MPGGTKKLMCFTGNLKLKAPYTFFIRNLVKFGELQFLKKNAILVLKVSYEFLKLLKNFLFLSDFQIFI